MMRWYVVCFVMYCTVLHASTDLVIHSLHINHLHQYFNTYKNIDHLFLNQHQK